MPASSTASLGMRMGRLGSILRVSENADAPLRSTRFSLSPDPFVNLFQAGGIRPVSPKDLRGLPEESVPRASGVNALRRPNRRNQERGAHLFQQKETGTLTA